MVGPAAWVLCELVDAFSVVLPRMGYLVRRRVVRCTGEGHRGHRPSHETTRSWIRGNRSWHRRVRPVSVWSRPVGSGSMTATGRWTCGSTTVHRPRLGTPRRVAAEPSTTTIGPGMRCRHSDRRPPFTAFSPHQHVGDGTPWRRSVRPAAAGRDRGRCLRRRPTRLRPGQAEPGVRARHRRPRHQCSALRQPRSAGGVRGGGRVRRLHRSERVFRPRRSRRLRQPGRIRVARRLRRSRSGCRPLRAQRLPRRRAGRRP